MSEPTHPEVAILNAALELPPDQRRAYLDKACAGDATLRERVEALVKADKQAEGFLESSPSAFFKGTVGVSLHVTEKPGDRIGRYKLLQKIGEGGCGVVYMAEQEEPVRRRVALKIIKLGMDTKQVIARFEAERQALAMMDHPNIAKVLDAGATETGRPYFVMELVRGITITDFCDDTELCTDERLRLFIEVCRAIQHAHQKGVIHRDIKPSNILVTVNDGVPVPKVIDFGIAKATQGRLTDLTLFTAFEQFMGTPAYMSPEQAVMTSLDVDTRSDIYSLGVLLYELLTGSTPFNQKELLAAGLDAMRRTIQEKEPPRPSTRLSTMAAETLTTTAKHRQTEAPKLIHLLRGDLDWIVMKCLEKDRKRRYETANGLAMDLQRYMDNDPVVARPPTAAYRLQKLVRRNRLVFVASGAVFASLLVGLVVSTWMFVRERESRHQAEAAGEKSEQIAQFLTAMLEGVGPSKALGRDTTMLQEILDETAHRIGNELEGQPVVEAELRTTLGEVYEALDQYEQAEAMHRVALELREQVFGPEHPLVANSLNRMANAVSHQEGRMAEAQMLQQRALAMQQGTLPVGHVAIAQSLNDLALMLQRSGDPRDLPEAERLQLESIDMLGNWEPKDNEQMAKALGNLAVIFARQQRWNDAVSQQQEALDLQEELLDPGHPDIASSLNNLSVMLLNAGRMAEAEATAREALRRRLDVLGPDHSYVATSYGNVASVLWQRMKLEEAERYQRKALAIEFKALGTNDAETLQSLNNLGTILNAQGRFEEAEDTHRQVLAARIEGFGAKSAKVGESLHNLAEVLRDSGRFEEAEDLQQQVLEILTELLPADNPTIPVVLGNLARVKSAQGKYLDAETNQLRALAIWRRIPDQQDLHIAMSLNALGRLYREAGRLTEAETNLLQALELSRTLPSDHALLLGNVLESLALLRLDQGQFDDAVQRAQGCLTIREQWFTNNWRVFIPQSLLGRAQLQLGNHAQAEPSLLSSCEGMRDQLEHMPVPTRARYREAVQSLIELYTVTDRPKDAVEWREELSRVP